MLPDKLKIILYSQVEQNAVYWVRHLWMVIVHLQICQLIFLKTKLIVHSEKTNYSPMQNYIAIIYAISYYYD